MHVLRQTEELNLVLTDLKNYVVLQFHSKLCFMGVRPAAPPRPVPSRPVPSRPVPRDGS
jgi:hypothetical protein